MNKIEELESRIETLECLLGVEHPKKPEVYSTGEGPSLTSFDNILVRKPIMYLYNFSGDTLNCTVDFKTNIVADSVPEIRKDNKIVFSLDSDSFINDKYSYLYYEFDITGNEPKSSANTFIRNNKTLDNDLERLAKMMGLINNEVTDFVCYWSLELKRSETEFWKCEIFDETKLEKLFPLDISPVPNYLVRRYVKFIPVEKMGKGNITAEQFRPAHRTGQLRVIEWGGWITGESRVR